MSKINHQVSFPTITTWSFILLLSATVIKVLTKLNAKEGGIEIKEYVSLEEELIIKAYIIN